MIQQEKVKDSVISQKVKERLSSAGLRAPCQVAVVSTNGQVTVSGSIQYEHQRPLALRAIRGVTGVQRVVDQMRVIPGAERHGTSFRSSM